jgi:hypothetical protein
VTAAVAIRLPGDPVGGGDRGRHGGRRAGRSHRGPAVGGQHRPPYGGGRGRGGALDAPAQVACLRAREAAVDAVGLAALVAANAAPCPAPEVAVDGGRHPDPRQPRLQDADVVAVHAAAKGTIAKGGVRVGGRRQAHRERDRSDCPVRRARAGADGDRHRSESSRLSFDALPR